METEDLQLLLRREIDDLERRHGQELDDHRQQQGANELTRSLDDWMIDRLYMFVPMSKNLLMSRHVSLCSLNVYKSLFVYGCSHDIAAVHTTMGVCVSKCL